MSSTAVLWIIICIIMVIAEIATLQLVSIWFAGGALLAFIASFFLPFEWQFGIFAFSSLALLLCTMPFIKKFKNQKYIPTNYDIDIGKTAVVTETIDKKNNSGRAVLNDVNWLAVSENENDVIEKGENVIIKDIKGAKLIVSRK
ncbi:MAG TPA: NfeD family protein [Ruminococcus sp.]|nr:NfeD family protein [Ruminococcus sp.]HCR73027.1 NfeD family protein [Ruminococcus sp.]